jgi:VIT1/CCC1 family predicted Fe2+/Mn2+ transporter
MANDTKDLDQHVGERLSGFVDGELTQQDRQRVLLHCEQCPECSENLAELQALRVRIGKARLSTTGEDTWRETMNDSIVQTSKGLGWILVIIGLAMALGAALYVFFFSPDMSPWQKFMVFAIYGGLAVLLFSVLRQRLIERKTDKYKDVDI